MYWNNNTDKLTVIPYVFIRSLPEHKAARLCGRIAEILPAKFSNIRQMLKKKSDNLEYENKLSEYRMRLLTCVMSNLYWDDFRVRYGLPRIEHMDVDTLRKSFGETIAGELRNIQRDDVSGLFDLYTKRKWAVSRKRKWIISSKRKSFYSSADRWHIPIAGKLSGAEGGIKSESVMPSANLDNQDKWIKEHFLREWMIDEGRAKQGKKRNQGRTIEDFLRAAGKYTVSRFEVLAKLVNCWDIGVAAANFTVDDAEHMIGCHVRPGEQSYKIILENNPEVMQSLITLSGMLTRAAAKQNRMIYEEYRKEMLLKLLERFQQKQPISDYSLIKQIIKESNGYMNAWDQQEVFSYSESALMDQKDVFAEFVKEKI